MVQFSKESEDKIEKLATKKNKKPLITQVKYPQISQNIFRFDILFFPFVELIFCKNTPDSNVSDITTFKYISRFC